MPLYFDEFDTSGEYFDDFYEELPLRRPSGLSRHSHRVSEPAPKLAVYINHILLERLIYNFETLVQGGPLGAHPDTVSILMDSHRALNSLCRILKAIPQDDLPPYGQRLRISGRPNLPQGYVLQIRAADRLRQKSLGGYAVKGPVNFGRNLWATLRGEVTRSSQYELFMSDMINYFNNAKLRWEQILKTTNYNSYVMQQRDRRKLKPEEYPVLTNHTIRVTDLANAIHLKLKDIPAMFDDLITYLEDRRNEYLLNKERTGTEREEIIKKLAEAFKLADKTITDADGLIAAILKKTAELKEAADNPDLDEESQTVIAGLQRQINSLKDSAEKEKGAVAKTQALIDAAVALLSKAKERNWIQQSEYQQVLVALRDLEMLPDALTKVIRQADNAQAEVRSELE